MPWIPQRELNVETTGKKERSIQTARMGKIYSPMGSEYHLTSQYKDVGASMTASLCVSPVESPDCPRSIPNMSDFHSDFHENNGTTLSRVVQKAPSDVHSKNQEP